MTVTDDATGTADITGDQARGEFTDTLVLGDHVARSLADHRVGDGMEAVDGGVTQGADLDFGAMEIRQSIGVAGVLE